MSKKRKRADKVKVVIDVPPRKKFKTSPMQGRRPSLEDRGPNAKKLGRKFKFDDETETERFVVTLNLKKGDMEEFIKRTKSKSKADAICKIVERVVK